MTPVSNNSVAIPNQINILEAVPIEIAGHILSFCDTATIQSLAMTSKALSRVTIETTNYNEHNALIKYINGMLLHLDDDASQKAPLEGIFSSLKEEFPNLISLRKYMIYTKNQIIDILATLSAKKLDEMQSISSPCFFNNIVAIAKMCQKIAPARALLDVQHCAQSLLQIYRDLVREKEFARAIAVTTIIPNYNFGQWEAFRKVFKSLVQGNGIDQAIVFVKMILDKTEQSWALRQIIQVLIEVREFDRAIAVAQDILDESQKSLALLDICQALAREKEFEKATDLAKTISNAFTREVALQEIPHISEQLNN